MDEQAHPERDPQLSLMAQVLATLVTGDTEKARAWLAAATKSPTPATPRQGVPVRTQAQVFARDRYTCGYCGRLTICPPALRYISEWFPTLVPYDVHWKLDRTHPLYWSAYASCDHLIPVAAGGSGEMDNLVTSCYKCNSTKANWLLEDLGWTRRLAPDVQWDGLSGLFVQAMRAAPIDKPYFRAWLRALTILE